MTSPLTIDQLQASHGIENQVWFESGQGGLTRIIVQTPLAQAEIYLYGAHLTHWQPTGAQPVLFMSKKSSFEKGKPIRGGVPLCFPWFGDALGQPDVPANPANHGFVRIYQWNVEQVTLDPRGQVVITLFICSSETTGAIWPHAFELRHTITIGQELSMSLQTRNMGTKDFIISEALHTYLQVSDVRQVQVRGLENQPYFSKLQNATIDGSDKPIEIDQEVDRVYTDFAGPCLLHDPGFERTIQIQSTGSASTVVWNPWVEKSIQMPDFGDDEWPHMLCIETANVMQNTQTIAPGEGHQMQTTLSLI